MSFSTTFQRPSYAFFEGAISGTTILTPFTVSLDQYQYPIDLRQYKASSQDTLKPSYSTSQVVDESLFNANGAWSRYRYNWNEGADQEFGDLREDANAMRFKASKGVDVWTEHELKLLPTTEQQLAVTNSGVFMCVTDERLWVGIGSTLYYQDIGDVGGTPIVNTMTLLGTISGITTDGYDVYVATSQQLYKIVHGSTVVPAAAGPTRLAGVFTNVAFVANRLLAAKANVLYEISATLTLGTAIKTHYQASFSWTTIFNVGSRIYFGGYSGSRSELYSATTDSAGALVSSSEAAPLPPRELLNTALSYAGSVLLGTSKGVRLAQVGADGTLSYGPLVDKVGDVRCITAEGRFAWCGWSAFQDGGSGVARLALDVNVAPLQPAYASDLYTDTASTVHAVARINNLTVFATGNGVYVESVLFCPTGYLDQGVITFSTVEQKVLTSGLVRHSALLTDEEVTLEIQDSNGNVLATGTSELNGDSSYEFDLGGELVTDINPIIRLTSGSVFVGFIGPAVWVRDVYTPVLSHWRIRCFPVTPPVEQWVVPLILQSRVVVNGGMGQEMSMNVFDEAERIKGWWRTKQPLIYREGNTATRVRIDAYELAPVDWNDSGTFFEATMTVRLVTA